MRKPLALLAAAVTLTVAVAACGGSAHSAAPATSSTTSTASSASSAGSASASKLTISAASSGALMFNTRTAQARAGTVTITFVNHSTTGHNLTLAHGTNGSVIGATPTFEGGSRTLTLHLSAGTYTYYCSVPGHRQAGMQGTLTVSS